MELKKIRKNIAYFAGWLALQACSLILVVLPGRLLYAFARVLAVTGFVFASKQRRIALESLRVAFGATLTPVQQRRIARDCFVGMAKSSVELLFMMDRPQLIRSRVRFSGKEHLDAALSRGNGVILVSAHFGNFPLLLARLSLEGYPTAGIMRQMRDARVERLFTQKRERLCIKTIYSQPRNVCVDTTIRSLRANELVFIPLDQNFGTAGVFVEFFGRKAATATGPVILAQRTKAALLPCFIVRQADDTHTILFEPAIDVAQAGSGEGALIAQVQELTRIIEKYIRQYPAEWGWIHRRWKSQPTQGR